MLQMSNRDAKGWQNAVLVRGPLLLNVQQLIDNGNSSLR